MMPKSTGSAERETRSSTRERRSGTPYSGGPSFAPTPEEKDSGNKAEEKYVGFDPASARIIREDKDRLMADSMMNKQAEGQTPPTIPPTPPAPTNSKRQKEPSDDDDSSRSAKRVNRANRVISNLELGNIPEPARQVLSRYLVSRLNALNIEPDDIVITEFTNVACHAWKEGRRSVDTEIVQQATTVIPNMITTLATNINGVNAIISALQNIPAQLNTALRTEVLGTASLLGQQTAKREMLLHAAENIYNKATLGTKADYINQFITDSGINLDNLRKDVNHYRTVAGKIVKQYTVLKNIGDLTDHPDIANSIISNSHEVRETAAGLSPSYVQ